MLLRDVERYEGLAHQRVDPACTAQKLEIVKLFVGRNFTSLWNGNFPGQQQAAPIARITDAFGDTGAPGEPGGIESILEKQGDVELLRAKFLRQTFTLAQAFVRGFRIVGNEFVADLLAAIDVGYIGTSNNCDGGVPKAGANGAKSGQSHDGVANPVGGANQNLHAATPPRSPNRCRRSRKNWASSGSSSAIKAMYTSVACTSLWTSGCV